MVAALGAETSSGGNQVLDGLDGVRRRGRQHTMPGGAFALPLDGMIHQHGERHAPDYALRDVGLADDPAGLKGDVLGAAGHSSRAAAGLGLAPRQIRGSSRNPRSNRRTVGDVLGLLRADHHGTCGVESLFLLLAAGEVAFHRGPRPEAVGPDQRLECGVDLGDQVALQLLADLERFAGNLRSVVTQSAGAVQQVAVHIHDRDGFRPQPLHRAGHQVGDGEHVLLRDLRGGPQFQYHAGLGGFLLVQKNGFLGQRQVHARFFHLGQRHHGALNLSLEGALVIDVLDEIGGAEGALVKQLEADAAGLGKAGRGQGQPGFRQF